MKKVAILMSTYNGEKYLEKQIDSILNQKFNGKIDIYIRDDGSKDNTVQIIKQYQKHNKNIYLQKGKNIGCNASFWELLKNITGYDYYSFSDQDDIWLEDKIQSAINNLEKENNNIPLLYGSCSILVNNDLENLGTTQKKHKNITFYNTIIQNFLPGHSQVMNEALRKEITSVTIDTSNIYYYDSWITNLAAIKGKIIFDNNPHTYYRQHNNNEIGYGKSKIGWYKERIKRINNSQTRKISKQIDYFIAVYGDSFSEEQSGEMQKYQKSKKNLFSRIKYANNCKLYRQRKTETRLFKMMYTLGLY